jgi:hypothetical protein
MNVASSESKLSRLRLYALSYSRLPYSFYGTSAAGVNLWHTEPVDGLPLFDLLSATLYAAVGIALLLAAVALVRRFFPFDVFAEIRERQNVAVAVLAGALVLAAGLIIAASVH